MSCTHDSFDASVDVGRLTEKDGGPVTSYVCEVRVRCAVCGEAFGFIGPPAGVRGDGPTTSQDGLELRIPIAPGEVRREGPAYYELMSGRKPLHA
jgi:hypothetical protein